jgi:hypothetical protein
MARVVRRRKNPLLPILLIFVFLFLIAAVMATLAYNKGQSVTKGKAQAIARGRKIISEDERGYDAIKKILVESSKDSKAPTVVAVLNKRLANLVRKVTGEETTSAVAIARIEAAIGQNTFALNAISTAKKTAADDSAEVTKLKAEIATLNANKANAVEAYNTLDTQFKTKAAALAAEVQTLTAAQTTMAAAHADALKASDADWQKKVTEQEQEVDTGLAKASKLSVSVNVLTLKVERLENELRIKRTRNQKNIAVRPDGKIKEVMTDRDVCFIPVGSQDRVVRGMTFRVFGPEGIPEDGEGHKASLTVVRVFKTISQCRVTTVRPDNPVAIGDPFANVAFDPTTQPIFVVEGRFDLSGMGRLTETGTQEVISLIKRSGGKIAKKLSLDVDFVVLGPEPSKPAEPAEDAPGTTKKAYEIRMEEYRRWKATLDAAIALNIPKLNTKRFLTFTGYDAVPEYQD